MARDHPPMSAAIANIYERHDPDFIADLRNSSESLWLAARWLWSFGYSVTVPPMAVRAKVQDMGCYSDNGDLWISKGSINERIEVKHRPKLHFTCAADYPFSTVFVDAAHNWDRARIKPRCYLIFNADLTYMAIVKGNTFPAWRRVEKMDRGRVRKFYECPIDRVSFINGRRLRESS
jgi:hypothetical protein